MEAQARVAFPMSVGRVIGLNVAAVAVTVATLLRLGLIAVPSHGYDSFAYKHWSWRLVYEPLGRFYIDDGQAFPDHLPGDLWLFKILGTVSRLVYPDIIIYGPVYGALISLMAISFDAILAITLLLIGRAIGRGRTGAIAAMAYWCAPAPIFVASVWGQIDGISIALAVIALGLGIIGRFSIAFIVLTLCVLVKPQFGMLALPLLAGWWHHDERGVVEWTRRVTITAVACIGTMALLSAPFDASLIGEWGQWSLIERIQLASDTYTVSVLGAHNIWILFDPLNWPPDDRTPWLLGFSRYAVGLTLFVACVLYAVWILLARWRSAMTMVLVSNILMFSFFLFLTRMHERYLFPVVALSILLAMMDRRYTRYAVTTGSLVFLNIGLRFAWTVSEEEARYPDWARLEWLEQAIVVQLLAILSIALFVWLANEGRHQGAP